MKIQACKVRSCKSPVEHKTMECGYHFEDRKIQDSRDAAARHRLRVSKGKAEKRLIYGDTLTKWARENPKAAQKLAREQDKTALYRTLKGF